jgi:hypothetical protein
MIASRAGSSRPAQAAISLSVRPQPMQSDDCGSMTQTWMQGVEGETIGAAFMPLYLGGGTADEKAAQAGDFGQLLRGARDIASLAADFAPRDRGHRQRGG